MSLTTQNRSPSYLLKTPYSWYFRMKVPIDLQSRIGKKELKCSLKTGYLSDAKYKARFIGGQVQKLFKQIRSKKVGSDMTKLDTVKINKIIKTFIRDFLDEEEEMRINRERPYTDEDLDHRAEFLGFHQSDLKESLAKCDYRPASKHADDCIEQHRLEVPKGSEDYNRLCRELLKAQIAVLEVEQKRVYGDYSQALPVIDGTVADNENSVSPNQQVQQQPQHKQTSDTMKTAGEDFWDEYNHDWKPRSKVDYRNAVDQIVSILGPHTQLHTIDYQRIKEFRNGMRSGELSKNGKPLSIARVNFFMGVTKRIFHLAMKKDRNLDRINPADGLQLRDKRKPSEKQDVFTTDELKLLFCESEEYGEDKHFKAPNFWIPLLALYTGARREELCQLLVEDVIIKDGIWCLDIREDNAERKSVKVSDRRIVPLHPFLVEDLKFPEYVHQRIDKRRKRIFHELSYVNHQWGHGFGRWFGKFKERCGIQAPPKRKTFHSFRHTLINYLKQNDAEKEHVKEFVGHKGREDMDWDNRGTPYLFIDFYQMFDK